MRNVWYVGDSVVGIPGSTEPGSREAKSSHVIIILSGKFEIGA